MEEPITNLHKLTDLQMFLDEIDREYGNRVAYRYFVNELIVDKTYSELTRDVKAVASWMVNKGYYGKHIAIVGSTSYHWVTTFLGITCSGNVVLPIDKMLSRHEILNIFDLGDVDIVFSSSEFEDLLQVVEQDEIRKIEVVRLDGNDFLEILQTPSVSLPKINPEELSEILFTSGTTGVSKGVMLTQKNITANMSEYYTMNILENITCPPVALSVLPIHHTY